MPAETPRGGDGRVHSGAAFDTTKPVRSAAREKCHVSHVVLDSNWEAKLAQSLEGMEEIRYYVKNQGLGFTIPYALDGDQRNYLPDYILKRRSS